MIPVSKNHCWLCYQKFLRRYHYYYFVYTSINSEGGVCVSPWEIQCTRFSISQGKLEFPISVPHYDEELRSLRSWGSQGSGCEGLMSTSNSAQRSLVVRVGSADLGQWYTLLWSVLLGHFTAVLWALNRFPPALFSTLTLSSPFSLVSFSFFIWSYHTIYRVP